MGTMTSSSADPQLTARLDEVLGRIDAAAARTGRDGAERRCPQRDSNPHCAAFKAAASADWAMGALAKLMCESSRHGAT